MSESYNYADFVIENELQHFIDFKNNLHVGDEAPDGELVQLGDNDCLNQQVSEPWQNPTTLARFAPGSKLTQAR